MRPFDWNILLLSFALLAAAKKCPPPRRDPHTKLVGKNASRQKFNTGEKVFYHCADGLTPSSGSPTVQCQHNGTWTQLRLKCDKKLCGDAGDLRNGYFEYNGTSVGDKVFAKCNEGYVLKGQNFLTCKKSGWAGDVPTCVEGEATCSPPAVANSVSSGGAVSAYRVGDSMTFVCSQGFQLDGAQKITCGPGGQWQPQPPRCLPSPERATRLPDKRTGGCGVPKTTSTSNANLADKYIIRTSFVSGEKVHYVCDVGYIQAGGSRYRTCEDGMWTPLYLRCERKSCGSAGEIANGQFEYTGVEFGDTAEAVCDEGHRIVGRATRTCMSGGWDGRVPTCEPVACEAPPEVPNAEMRGHQEPPYTYRSAVVYQCRVGSLQGAREIWCTKDGTWSAPPPTCKEITCPSPKVHGTYWAGAQKSLYQYRDTISIECYPGLERSGPRIVTCESDGQWSPGLPTCRPVRPQGEATCSPPAVANSVSSGGAVSAYRVGDSMTFVCSQGFQLDGAQEIICGPGGQWQPQPPRCLPSLERATLSPERAARLPEKSIRLPERATQLPDKQAGGCGVPKTTSTSNANLADKYITKTSFVSGEKVHYVCDVGYIQAGGSKYRTCKDGTWTPLHFRCERKSCGSAGEIANGQFEYTGVEFGDTAEAVCDEGHRIVGRATRTCMSGGWDGRVPTCEPVACEAPPEVPNAEMRGHQEPPYTYRSAVVYQCRVGSLQGAREIWCTKDGTWSAPPPTCKEIMCPSPKVHGTYWAGAQKSLYQYRDTISIECYPGLERSGPRIATCESDGQWSPGLPTCRPVRPQIMCQSPKVYGTSWAGAQRRLYKYRDTISIECYPGLKRSGPRIVTCESDGQWSPGLPTCRPVRPPHRSAHWGK